MKPYYLLYALFLSLLSAVFTAPLQKKGSWKLLTALLLPLSSLLIFLDYPLDGAGRFFGELVFLLLLSFYAGGSTESSWQASVYIAVWITVIGELYLELSVQAGELFRYAAGQDYPFYFPYLSGILLGALLLFFVQFFLAESMPSGQRYDIGPRQLSSALLLFIAMDLMYTLMSSEKPVVVSNADIVLYKLTLFLVEFYTITLLYLQTELFKKSAVEKELDALTVLSRRQKIQYDTARQNIQLINRRCHELKAMVERVRENPLEPEIDRKLAEVERAVSTYDAIRKTGNEVLDTVLTEKSMLCEAEQIQLNCIADGEAVVFLKTEDIYTLIGQAVDNAVHEVSLFKDRERRIIDVLIHRKNRFLMIHISNPLFRAVEFQNGLPVRGNGSEYEGYGLKAIQQVIKRYNGVLNLEAKEGVFAMRVLLPIPE